MRAAFGFNSRNSTADIKRYDSGIGFLSIRDYNNDTNINNCVVNGCEYTIIAVMSVTSSSKSLELDVFYTGAFRFNEALNLRKVELYYEGGKISQAVDVVIAGPGKITIPLNNSQESGFSIRR